MTGECTASMANTLKCSAKEGHRIIIPIGKSDDLDDQAESVPTIRRQDAPFRRYKNPAKGLLLKGQKFVHLNVDILNAPQ